MLDMCKLIQYATDQGFVVTGGELVQDTRTTGFATLRQGVLKP
jgi:hypothetical protein